MIEVVYRQENVDKMHRDTGFRLPKNIRQIGGGDSDIQVYMEDNVALYLSKVPDNEEDIRYGVLLGEVKKSCGYTYVFIKGAVDVREVFDNTVLFGDDIWTTLNDDIGRYYQGLKVAGWFLSQRCLNTNQNVWIKKVHLNNFAGMDKVFFKIDRDEEDEAFFYYGNDKMEKLPCYHIYYEKNQQMKDYMTGTNADIHFKKTVYDEMREGAITRAAYKKAEAIKEEIKMPGEKSESTDNISMADKNVSRINNLLGKAASFFVIGALAVTIGIMGKNGQLDNLLSEAKSLVNGIMNDADKTDGGDGIISVNGTPKTTPSAELQSTEEISETGTLEGENTTTDANAEPSTNPEEISEEEQSTLHAEETTTPQITEQDVSIEPVSTTTYMVKKGETLYSICRKLYGNIDNMKLIMELNGMENADEIYYGKNLIVP